MLFCMYVYIAIVFIQCIYAISYYIFVHNAACVIANCCSASWLLIYQGWTLPVIYFETSCGTSEGNFHLSEMKIHLPTFFVQSSLAGFSVPTTVFSINRVQIFKVEWEVQLSDSYFQASRAVGQSLMSIPVYATSSFCHH